VVSIHSRTRDLRGVPDPEHERKELVYRVAGN
jgi:hypothetical protein